MTEKNLNQLSCIDIKEAFRLMKASEAGLSESEVQNRLKIFGKNVLVEDKKNHWIVDLLLEFRNPMVIILVAAAAISSLFGEQVNALIILAIILFSTLLNFFQERKAGDAAKKLSEGLKTQVTAIRKGLKIDIKLEDVVPGELLFLNAGDLVPADSRVIEAKDFFVNQSALTGESFPVEKVNQNAQAQAESLSQMENIVFSGTNVVTGTATVLALKTGKETEFGKIAHSLNQAEPQTEFTRGINQFSMLIMRMTLMIVLAIFFFNVLLKKDLLDSFLFAIAVAVGLTPELLPMILSVNMSTGSVRMAKKGVIVKKLVAIPNFGSMDMLCTDKTGTLTEDRIVLVKYDDVFGNESEEVLLHAYLNSYFETGIANPMDQAVKNYKKIDLKGYQKIDEIPFDFLRRRMSVVVEKSKSRTLICKGAPEEIFKVCDSMMKGGRKIKLTKSNLSAAEKVYYDMSRDGYRVLAIATKTIKNGRKIYEIADESEMTLIGYVAFLDPAKTDVKQVVDNLSKAGVTIKIITGDNELVTQRICTELKIPVKGVMLGQDIDGMTDDALKVAAEKTTIFARFSPDEKNRIIRALQTGGHVVGYMGDGINDAPSLRTADVGISVNNAVDVAKESADMILTEKNLQVLLDGILEGRRTFGNSMKYIMMGVSSNFGNMFSVIGAVIFLPFLPMLPLQILLNNLLYDCSQITIPGDDVDSEYVAKPKRWNMAFVQKFMVSFGFISSFFDFLTFFVLFVGFGANAATFQTGWFMESLATQTLIIHIIRTRKVPFLESRASFGLTISTILVIAAGWTLPYTGLGRFFGFAPLPAEIVFSLAAIVAIYLVAVEAGKRLFYKSVKEV